MPEDEKVEYTIRIDKAVFDDLKKIAKERGFEINEFLFHLVEIALSLDSSDQSESKQEPLG